MSLPTRDAHQNLTVVADPYLRAVRYKKEVFGKDSFYNAGIVAIDVYFQNDNDLPIRLNLATIQTGDFATRAGSAAPRPAFAGRRSRPHAARRRTPTFAQHRPFPFPSHRSGSGHSKDWISMTTTLALGGAQHGYFAAPRDDARISFL